MNTVNHWLDKKTQDDRYPLTADGMWPFPSADRTTETKPKTLQEILDSLPDAQF